jgi:5'-phosphate synthase pdxT subunit
VPGDLARIDGLILPGGESTTMTLGIEREGLDEPIKDFVAAGGPLLATCAGTILLDEAHLGLLDISCRRNAYGAQLHSFEAPVSLTGDGVVPGTFIRAPRITRVGGGVEVRARYGEEPVGVAAANVAAYTFHPELTKDTTIHELFLNQKAGNK